MGTVSAKASPNIPPFMEESAPSAAQNTSQPEPVSNLEHIKARVDRVNVDGLGRTKDDIISDSVRNLFSVNNFYDVLDEAIKTRARLADLGCFKNIGVYIDTSKGPNASPNGFEVTFHVHELNKVTGGVSTELGNNEGSVLIGMKTPNMFGRGERLQVDYRHGYKGTNNFNFGFVKPFRGSLRPVLSTSIFQSNSDWTCSGYKLLERGLLFDLGFYTSNLLKHNLQWEANIRDVNITTRNTWCEVLKEAGLSMKSSVRHILSMDLRDDVIFPTAGSLFKFTSELAGLGGDVGFAKTNVFFQTNYSLAENITLQGSLSLDYMVSMQDDKKITIADMNFLGGPVSVRGFSTRGIGPHSDGYALGAMSNWAAGLHLFTPLPFRPGKSSFGELFRTHFFINAGNAGNFFQNDGDKTLLGVLSENMRVVYGIGIALRLGNMARLEVNYCFPYLFDKGDKPHPGVQFGVGVEFL